MTLIECTPTGMDHELQHHMKGFHAYAANDNYVTLNFNRVNALSGGMLLVLHQRQACRCYSSAP